MSNHTPGPWEASHDIDACCVATITSGWVVVPIGADPNKFDANADAQLIAAAPEMLDALEAATHVMPLGEEYYSVVEAIAKAKGETE